MLDIICFGAFENYALVFQPEISQTYTVMCKG